MRKATVERLGRDALERLCARFRFVGAEFLVCGEVCGEGGRCVAGGAVGGVYGDGDGGGHEEGRETECCACIGCIG